MDEKEYEAEIAKIKAKNVHSRRKAVIEVLSGLAVFVVIAALLAMWWAASHEDRANRAKLAQECIAAGNIWAHDECLITRKPS